MERVMKIWDIIESLPEWEKETFIRELIPMLSLPGHEVMEHVIGVACADYDCELYSMEDHEFLRMYMEMHDGEISLEDEIADRREYEWEYPQYK